MPEKLREMQVRFYAEAAKHNVLPIQTSAAERFGEGIRPSLTGDRKTFAYTAGMKRIPEGAAPPIKNRSWSLTTEATLKGDESGVIATQGGVLAGWALYFDQGKPVFSYSFTNGERWRIAAKEPLPAGKHNLVMNFTYDGGGMGKGGAVSIKANDKVVAEGRVERTVPFRFSTEETLDIGEDTGTPVDLSYDIPARFTGELGKIVIDLK
jgi:arylsulfatase